MTWEQGTILVVLAGTLAVFVWDRWRYDLVAMTSLMVCVLVGLVGPDQAFVGFSNPAVITVAAVLVISRALGRSGAIDALAARLIGVRSARFAHLASFCVLGALLSAFMNNVGALALLLPVALSTARRHGYAPALLLMPLSFATLLGGMTTLIGTPPNLLIAGFRAQATGERFLLFDFAPTGLAVSVAGIAYLLLVGWRFLPADRGPAAGDEAFEVGDYVTEARVPPASRLVGQAVGRFAADSGIVVLGVVRAGRNVFARLAAVALQADDILLLQADTARLARTIEADGLELVQRSAAQAPNGGGELNLIEAVVLPNAVVQGSSPSSLDLRRRYGVTLVAASRQGRRFEGRLGDATLSVGDVLLLEGEPARLRATVADLGCLPLADRRLTLQPRRIATPIALFAAGIALAASGLLPAAAAFTSVVVAMLLTRVIRPAQLYDSIDWPVIVLLGAMIPLGDALQDTGAAQLIAGSILTIAGEVGPLVMLAVVLVMTMAITPVLNNAATAVIMAPIAISIAERMHLVPDAFLMAVAIGASCDFLTPFGHHNNAIIMGPGGYRFGDFWRVGLGLETVVLLVSLLAIPLVWPF
ncbi:MAG TPA: SLC13 family permease [Geminicoccaceae bacterium]|nr:SLC13 family permease [Geminicoccaceae bacterium]